MLMGLLTQVYLTGASEMFDCANDISQVRPMA